MSVGVVDLRIINYVVGDATKPQASGAKIIAHICNDVGAWGKGFVLTISRRWSEPEQMYRKWYRERDDNDFGLGAVQLVQVTDEIMVVNMVAQKGISRGKGGPPIRYEAVDACLKSVANKAIQLNASVHMPRIGTGLAGGEWSKIEPIINERLCTRDIHVYVYDLE